VIFRILNFYDFENKVFKKIKKFQIRKLLNFRVIYPQKFLISACYILLNLVTLFEMPDWRGFE